jgi:hypothetical protein
VKINASCSLGYHRFPVEGFSHVGQFRIVTEHGGADHAFHKTFVYKKKVLPTPRG